jgi:hypothetical protein
MKNKYYPEEADYNYFEQEQPRQDEEDEEDIQIFIRCFICNGSGEGQTEDITCYRCQGTGMEK